MIQQKQLCKQWQASQLNAAINCLVYGTSCLYYDKINNKLFQCKLSIHQQYINILHVIVNDESSILFELQNITNISDHDIFIKQSLESQNYQFFIIIYTNSLESHPIVLLSQNQKNVIWEGLQFFTHEAKNFYRRISEMDPFKAEATMLFLSADVDGSGLLDIDEVQGIFRNLKINRKKEEILEHILSINEDLYEKENLKKSSNFRKDNLTLLGFEYLLKYYCIKKQLAPIFTSYCPLFKIKQKNKKKTIADILKEQQKALMSGVQLSQFMRQYLHIEHSEDQATELIKTFPIYDGEGKEIIEESELLSFNNFSNFIFSSFNSLVAQEKLEVYQNMNLSLSQYYIYTSHNTYVSGSRYDSDSKLEMYEISLKKGCRCIQLDITQSKEDELIVKHKSSHNYIQLEDVLKTIRNVGFTFNPYPIILSIENNCRQENYKKLTLKFNEILGDLLFTMPKDPQKTNMLPSPNKLKGRIILSSNNVKKDKSINEFEAKIFLNAVKIDFEKKGQYPWNTCTMEEPEILKYEDVENKNLTDYCRTIMVRSCPKQKKIQVENYDPSPMFRNGVQLIAINTQIEDKHHYYLHSRFLENGGPKCGYLLKPQWMMGSCLNSQYSSEFSRPSYKLVLNYLSGQKCLLINIGQSVQYYLQVYLKGSRQEERVNKVFRSQVQTEGFYTEFNLECEFSIYCYDIACVVMNIIGKGRVLASRSVPVHLMRQGLHTIQLLGERMQLTDNSYLLVNYKRQELEKVKKGISFS